MLCLVSMLRVVPSGASPDCVPQLHHSSCKKTEGQKRFVSTLAHFLRLVVKPNPFRVSILRLLKPGPPRGGCVLIKGHGQGAVSLPGG